MARQQALTGVAGLTSQTWYPFPPVELGRAGGAVATVALGTATGDNGTSGGTNGVKDAKATTTDGNGSGLVLDLTIGSNVCTGAVVDAAASADGDGYRIGDKITVSAANATTATPVVFYVTSLEYEN